MITSTITPTDHAHYTHWNDQYLACYSDEG